MTGAAALHLESVPAGPDDYGAAYRLMTRGLWRSRPVRRQLFGRDFLVLLGWSAAAGLLVPVYYVADGMAAGASLGRMLRWLSGLVPAFVIIVVAIPALLVVAKCAVASWSLRRHRRKREAAIGAHVLALAWNSERFGVVLDGKLHAWPIADLLAWDETQEHLFVVAPESETLFPIRLAGVDHADLSPLRRALAEAQVPGLWAYAERDLLRRMTAPPTSPAYF
ncbi:MAG TPA: hypothetical protein VEX35_05580 [Allosphingosinicella sp.]|nr:hypothetical protein [Allosphingosinicella sp.]